MWGLARLGVPPPKNTDSTLEEEDADIKPGESPGEHPPVVSSLPQDLVSCPQYGPLHPAEPQQCPCLSHQAIPHGPLRYAAGDVLIEVAVAAAFLAIRPLGTGDACVS